LATESSTSLKAVYDDLDVMVVCWCRAIMGGGEFGAVAVRLAVWAWRGAWVVGCERCGCEYVVPGPRSPVREREEEKCAEKKVRRNFY
jgi:hypothetical protein